MKNYEVDFQAEDWPDKLIQALEDLILDAESALNTMDLVEESMEREINGLKIYYGDKLAYLDKPYDSLSYLTGECKAIVKIIRELIEAYHCKKIADLDRLNNDKAEIPAMEE